MFIQAFVKYTKKYTSKTIWKEIKNIIVFLVFSIHEIK